MTSGGVGFGSPTAGITRTEAQAAQREAEPAMSDNPRELSERELEIKGQFDEADKKFAAMLDPEVGRTISGMIAKVAKQYDVKPSELATPDWLKNMTIVSNNLELGFNEMADEMLVDVTIADNRHLTQLGMETAFDVQTRTGAFKYLDKKLAGVRSDMKAYTSNNALELEARILEDTKRIVQEGIDEGLRGRDVAKRLKDELPGEYSKGRLETIVRTNTTAIVNQGKLAFARANDDFVRGMRFQAVLDDGTTQTCEERDGKEFALNDPALDANTPPLHFSCRSILDYIITGSPKYDPAGVTTTVPEGFGGDI